jgi:hypothetical protein
VDLTVKQKVDLVEELSEAILNAWRAVPKITDTRVVVAACTEIQRRIVEKIYGRETGQAFQDEIDSLLVLARFKLPVEKAGLVEGYYRRF